MNNHLQSDRPDVRARRLLSAYPRAVPIVIFLLIAAITSFSIYSIEVSDRSRNEALLNERAQTVSAALERRSATMSSYLRAGAALIGTMEEVTPERFEAFVRNLQADTSGGSSDGIGYAPWVSPTGIDDFEADFRERTGQTIDVFPRPKLVGERALPVMFLLPRSPRNDRAIGFNMASEENRLRAIQLAAKLNSPVASDKVILLQEGGGEESGFIIYMPVYDRGSATQNAKGFIYAPFNARMFLEAAIEQEIKDSTGLRLYDRAIASDRLLAELAPNRYTGITKTIPVSIANHEMVLVVESARGNALSPLSMLTLLFGIMVATLLMMLVRLVARQTAEDEARFIWLDEQNSIRNSLTRELNHRVKNTLANVLSILALTRRRTSSLNAFADSLDGRIRALSATHDLLTQSEWGTTPIREVIEAELAPYAEQFEPVLHLEGPDVEIAPNDALSLGMAIHELATNAAKYGSLSRAGGKVSVSWKALNEHLAQLDWVETGGPDVATDRQPGFGTNLIEKIVAHELRNPVDLQFRITGVTCTLTVPLRKPSDFAIRARR